MARLGKIRFGKYIPQADGSYKRQSHFTLTQECAVCGKMALMRMNEGQLLSIEHFNLEDDQACPVVQQHNRMGPRANLTFNYGDLEDRMHSAKAALKREDDRVSRLDGRPKFTPTEEITDEDLENLF